MRPGDSGERIKNLRWRPGMVSFSLPEKAADEIARGAFVDTAFSYCSVPLDRFVHWPQRCVVCLTPVNAAEGKSHSPHIEHPITAVNVSPQINLSIDLHCPLCSQCRAQRDNVAAERESLKQAFPAEGRYEEKKGTFAAMPVFLGALSGSVAWLVFAVRIGMFSDEFIVLVLALIIALLIFIGLFVLLSNFANGLHEFVSKISGRYPSSYPEYSKKKKALDALEKPIVEVSPPAGAIDAPLLGSKTVNDAIQEFLLNYNTWSLRFNANPEYARLFAEANTS